MFVTFGDARDRKVALMLAAGAVNACSCTAHDDKTKTVTLHDLIIVVVATVRFSMWQCVRGEKLDLRVWERATGRHSGAQTRRSLVVRDAGTFEVVVTCDPLWKFRRFHSIFMQGYAASTANRRD